LKFIYINEHILYRAPKTAGRFLVLGGM